MVNSKKSVGIFAGTFDPIHNGHLEVALLAKKECFLSEVYFAVEEEPWGNKNPANIEHRRKMVDLAIKDKTGLRQLFLPDKRFNIEKTLPYLEKTFKGTQLFFIFGADVFLKINNKSWHELEKLLKHHLIIFERSHTSEKAIHLHAKGLGISIAILPSKYLHYSSTTVRTNQQKGRMLMSDANQQYVNQHKLYK